MSSQTRFAAMIDKLPEQLARGLEVDWQRLSETADDDFPWAGLDDETLLKGLAKAWVGSRFVAQSCISDPSLLADLLGSGLLQQVDDASALLQRLVRRCEGSTENPLAAVEDEADVMRYLRTFRRAEMVRIAWRDLAGKADLDETLRDLSNLADLCVRSSVQWLQTRQQARWGIPLNHRGESMQLVVLAMGKLGAGELNFSSDIDLILAFEEDAALSDGVDAPGNAIKARDKTCAQFFTTIAQGLIRLLDTRNADGFVFRVDTRLRPYGDSGPLVMSFDAMEQYYQNAGRDWERYALIKARPITGGREACADLMARLRPFVYRRYIDFSVIEALREMKAMIDREVLRKGVEDNVKLGRGGIREVEFIAQALQLVHGGRDPDLQRRDILGVLALLSKRGLLPAHIVSQLRHAWVFLRRCENRIQEQGDQQTHRLPVTGDDRSRLAYAMGFAHWHELSGELDVHRSNVAQAFAALFDAPQRGDVGQSAAQRLWNDELEPGERHRLLLELGYEEPQHSDHHLQQFHGGALLRRLSPEGRQRLDRLMPLLLAAAGYCDNGDETLKRVIAFIESVARRSAYFDLLVENPLALGQLVRLISASSWVAQVLGQQPVLLDELLDGRSLYKPPDREEMAEDLRLRLARVENGDVEREMVVLRQFKQAVYLRTAAAELAGVLPLMLVSDTLTVVAELCVEQVLQFAWRDMTLRHGEPRCEANGEGYTPAMAVIAYGKLGGLELGYGSDLDLVFLHNASAGSTVVSEADPAEGASTAREVLPRSVDNEVFFSRLGQRVVHWLTATTVAGQLYEVDMRLRPNGESGHLVSSLDAFERYQANKAWTWEHQALVRARKVAGNPQVGEAFEQIRRRQLCQPRDRERLRKEVCDMRLKMREALGSKPSDGARFDLKQDTGGIVDIEFMVQYGVLAWAENYPALCEWTDNIRILASLARFGLVAEEDAELLAQAYLAYRSRSHEAALQGKAPRLDGEEFSGYRQAVILVWQKLMQQGSW